MTAPRTPQESLTRLALDEICGVFGMPPEAHWRGFIESLFQRTARSFAAFGAAFDQKVAQWGLDGAARWAVAMFASEVEVDGEESNPGERSADRRRQPPRIGGCPGHHLADSPARI